MKKKFNTTGVCVKDLHYMMDISKKINKVMKMVEYGDYFIINRPRQFGKTTFLSLLTTKLEEECTVISISFEGVGDESFSNEEKFCTMFINEIMNSFRFINKDEYKRIKEMSKNMKLDTMVDLSNFITEYIEDSEKEVVLIIDEVDKISHNILFLSFLGMLRNKYLKARERKDLSFKSVILAGVHDIKNLKIGIRDKEEKRYNSPWNIAVNFNVDMTFSISEIESMLIEYKDDNNIDIDTKKLSERIHYYTGGYGFLISRLCQIIDEEIYDDKDETMNNNIIWDEGILRKSIKILLKENNTLFDDLIKNLENNSQLNSFIYEIVFNGSLKQFNIDNPVINLAYVYGIIRDDDGIVKVSNRIFEQRIYNYYTSKAETASNNLSELFF